MAEEERGRNGTEASRGEERIGKERNRDCPSEARCFVFKFFLQNEILPLAFSSNSAGWNDFLACVYSVLVSCPSQGTLLIN